MYAKLVGITRSSQIIVHRTRRWTGDGGTGTEEFMLSLNVKEGCGFRHCLGTGHWDGIPDIYNHNHFIVNLRHKMNLIFFFSL